MTAGPAGIFDVGLGAYGVIAAVRRAAPGADVVYHPDRASFPYGRTSLDELARVVGAGARELERRVCTTVVVASNAPSMTVLPQVEAQVSVPVVGVFPPVRAALDACGGDVVVRGAASMVESPELALTLSSTHLAWLRPFVEAAAPGVMLLDPADDVATAVAPRASRGGALTCIVTERPGPSASDFTRALRRLTDAAGVEPIEPQVVAPRA